MQTAQNVAGRTLSGGGRGGATVDYCKRPMTLAGAPKRSCGGQILRIELAAGRKMNRSWPRSTQLFMPNQPEYSFLAVRLVKDIARMGGDVSNMYRPTVPQAARRGEPAADFVDRDALAGVDECMSSSFQRRFEGRARGGACLVLASVTARAHARPARTRWARVLPGRADEAQGQC